MVRWQAASQVTRAVPTYKTYDAVQTRTFVTAHIGSWSMDLACLPFQICFATALARCRFKTIIRIIQIGSFAHAATQLFNFIYQNIKFLSRLKDTHHSEAITYRYGRRYISTNITASEADPANSEPTVLENSVESPCVRSRHPLARRPQADSFRLASHSKKILIIIYLNRTFPAVTHATEARCPHIFRAREYTTKDAFLYSRMHRFYTLAKL
jgi:hypothetical protein